MERTKTEKRISRHAKVRAKISGTAERPRVSVFRSNRGLVVQFIDDIANKTVLSAKTQEMKKMKGSKSEKSEKIGEALAKRATAAGIKEVVFDRGGFQFHGRVKALAESLRKGGIKF